MKIILFVFALVAAVSARPQGYSSEEYENPNYEFTWQVDTDDSEGNLLKFGHREARDGPRVEGQYYILLPDTRLMKVQYYADDSGYHPIISYEGTPVYPDPPTYQRYQ